MDELNFLTRDKKDQNLEFLQLFGINIETKVQSTVDSFLKRWLIDMESRFSIAEILESVDLLISDNRYSERVKSNIRSNHKRFTKKNMIYLLKITKVFGKKKEKELHG